MTPGDYTQVGQQIIGYLLLVTGLLSLAAVSTWRGRFSSGFHGLFTLGAAIGWFPAGPVTPLSSLGLFLLLPAFGIQAVHRLTVWRVMLPAPALSRQTLPCGRP